MTSDWTAVAVRARGLAGRRLGRVGAQNLARTTSLAEALALLAHTPYNHDVRPDMNLASAEHAVASTLLWHLRILAGWAPTAGMRRIRVLAAGFEIADITGHLADLEGRASIAPYELGALKTAWTAVAQAASETDVRGVLSTSAWGDPGCSDLATVSAALQTAWARRILTGVPEATEWARIFAGVLLARMHVAHAPPVAGSVSDRNLHLVLGGGWDAAVALANRDSSELWRAEAAAWIAIEASALRLQTAWLPGPAAIVAVAGLLAVDAWRTRAALEIASRGGKAPDEAFDVLA